MFHLRSIVKYQKNKTHFVKAARLCVTYSYSKTYSDTHAKTHLTHDIYRLETLHEGDSVFQISAC